jgi:hypothetical protein
VGSIKEAAPQAIDISKNFGTEPKRMSFSYWPVFGLAALEFVSRPKITQIHY